MLARTFVPTLRYAVADTHAQIFMEVMQVWGSSTPLTSICFRRLSAAYKLIQRIDEVSCGLWRIAYHPHGGAHGVPNKRVLVSVDLGAAYLRSVGINLGDNGDAREDHLRPNNTSISIALGCPECAATFATACNDLEREGRTLYEDE